MIFEGKFRRALEVSKQKKIDRKREIEENQIELEKNDLLAMMIAAFVVILPVAFILFGVLLAVIWFFFFR